MHSYKTEGFIIKRKNFGEADRILTVFTKNRGKISIIAKGVRKISSRRSPHTELLNLSVLTIHESRVPILTEAEALNHFSYLKNDLRKAGMAFYICELIDGLLPEHQENRAVFGLLYQILTDLEKEEENCKALINKFEQELLGHLGFWPKDRVFLEDNGEFIEDIMEKKLKTKRMFNLFF